MQNNVSQDNLSPSPKKTFVTDSKKEATPVQDEAQVRKR